jgi:hypothetical protein
MRGRFALGGLLVLVLAGCGGGNNVSQQDVAQLVLRSQDLPPVFSSFYNGALTRLDTMGTPRSDPTRFGRKAGWIARYNRGGTAATTGPLVVESRADVFGGAGGAKRDFALYRADLAKTPGDTHSVQVPKLGSETSAVTFTRPGQVTTRFYRIAWRDRNVTAALVVDGFDGKVTLGDAVALARKQERLIAAL